MQTKYNPSQFDILVEKVGAMLEKEAVHPNYLRIRALLNEHNVFTPAVFAAKWGDKDFKRFVRLYKAD